MSDLREMVIAAIKAKGPHAKASTIADAVMPLCMEEAARCAESYEPRCDVCPSGVSAAIRALATAP